MKTRLLALCVVLGLTAAIVATAQARAAKSAVVTLRKTSEPFAATTRLSREPQ